MRTKTITKNDFPFDDELNLAKLAIYYFDDFEKIANNPIWKKLTVRGINLSSRTIKQAYKEMETSNFRGDIIDYLCYVCLNYGLYHSLVIEKMSVLKSKDILKILRSFLNHQTVYLVLSCRLMLKDETYLDDVFKLSKIEKGEFYEGVKKFLYKKMNELLKVEPGIDKIHQLNYPSPEAFSDEKPKQNNESDKIDND